jgi:hypothetical protein
MDGLMKSDKSDGGKLDAVCVTDIGFRGFVPRLYWAVDGASVDDASPEPASSLSGGGGFSFNEKTATKIVAVMNAANKDQSVSLNDLVVASCTFSNRCCVARVERSKNSFVCSVAWAAIFWRYSLWILAISGSYFAVAIEYATVKAASKLAVTFWTTFSLSILVVPQAVSAISVKVLAPSCAAAAVFV